MCGRFFIHAPWPEYFDMLNLIEGERGRNTEARYNIAPTQDIIFAYVRDGERRAMAGRWWLVPFWAKELSSKYPTFNARSETMATKSTFRASVKDKRCLIPASGYYEWTKADDGGKDPHAIHLPDFQPFAFAGLWAHNSQLDVTSCTIVTAPAVKEIKHLHARMPVILDPGAYDSWLDPETDVDAALGLLENNLDHQLTSYRVAREVNSSRASGSHLIDPMSLSSS